MYKKILLSLMFLSLFSSSESLCVDPVTVSIICGVVSIVSGVTIKVINDTIDSYNLPVSKEVRVAQDQASIAQAKAITEQADVSAAQFHVQLERFEVRNKLIKCMVGSKSESKKNNKEIPIECHDLARMFAACVGAKELVKIITDLEVVGE